MAKLKTMAMFAVPITIVNFGEETKELNQQLIEDALVEREKHPDTVKRYAVRGWQSDVNMEDRYESYNTLREYVKSCVFSVLPSYGFNYEGSYDDVFICHEFWTNILTSRSSFHMPHIHGNGDIVLAGVYYPTSGLNVDGTEYYPNEDYDDVVIRASSIPDSGDLVLFDPAATDKRQVIPLFVNRYPYYGSEICIRPKQSHLIIFPNYLTHMVAPIVEDNKHRMSIAFSLTKKR